MSTWQKQLSTNKNISVAVSETSGWSGIKEKAFFSQSPKSFDFTSGKVKILIMLKFFVFALILLCGITTSMAQCNPFRASAVLNVCRNAGRSDCTGVSSRNICNNLVGPRPFISGNTSGNYRCSIFAGVNCSGREEFVNRAGFTRFPFEARSMRCPCI